MYEKRPGHIKISFWRPFVGRTKGRRKTYMRKMFVCHIGTVNNETNSDVDGIKRLFDGIDAREKVGR